MSRARQERPGNFRQVILQPHSDDPELSQEAARQHLQGALGAQSSAFTDVQVQRQEHEHEPGTSPGHYQQP
ncbi:hypothetical protein HCG45_08225 [Pseudomonas fulva]|nr:hypothetical protein [Pseudomonas fulva]HAL68881.1 hypothetical protein [Pseudomonas sp.]